MLSNQRTGAIPDPLCDPPGKSLEETMMTLHTTIIPQKRGVETHGTIHQLDGNPGIFIQVWLRM
jgi:hypothetical protein